MKLKNKIIKIAFFILYIYTFPIYSESNSDRKKLHIYITPAYINNLNQKGNVWGTSDQYLNLMFGLFNNFYLGLSYTNGNRIGEQYSIYALTRQNQLTLNRKSDHLTGEKLIFKSQFFFWNNFYTSINLGVEKGYKIYENLFSISSNNNPEIQPYQTTTIFADRLFGSIGLGYRREFLSNFIIGTEFEFGYLSARKINKYYTFDPGYSSNYINTYLITKDMNEDKNGSPRNYHFISIYAGVAI
ncbi:hypothetical protein [Leptospira terpstrae]|uniref:Outer membrane protein beta-barrel domain protein n=1 Tax=Leptospira terpstrae serovar Hualin str. LT 11-33 = ATCC 700639 TaxID=1257025 RepID=N1VSI2_9LEPT|nr:hypothetical protein [Leptospira terpstrae]EMY59952.1 hypothetical protein LEP1GSC203_1073 [Leptospira terpstrae serovar Hualin str. LT 11-33 = ATCC 700639]